MTEPWTPLDLAPWRDTFRHDLYPLPTPVHGWRPLIARPPTRWGRFRRAIEPYVALRNPMGRWR